MTRKHVPILLMAGLAALAGARVAAAWPNLPQIMASHFGASGRPDGFMSRGSFFAILAGVWFLVVLLPSLLIRFVPPELVNIPHRAYWMAAGRRKQTLARLRVWLAWLGVAISALFVGVVELTLRANLERSNLDKGAFLGMLTIFLVVTGLLLVSLYRQFRVPNTKR